jgi:hypothetical protein
MLQTFKCGNHGINIEVDECPQCKIDLLEKEMVTLREKLEELEIWKKSYDDISTTFAVKTNNLGIALKRASDFGIALRRASDDFHNLEASIQKICEAKAKPAKQKRKSTPKS